MEKVVQKTSDKTATKSKAEWGSNLNVKSRTRLEFGHNLSIVLYLVLTPVFGFLLIMGCTQNVCSPWSLDIPLELESYINVVDMCVIFAFFGLQALLSSLPIGKLYKMPSKIGTLEYRCGAWFNVAGALSVIVVLHLIGYKVTVFPEKGVSYVTASAIFGLILSTILFYKGKNPKYPNPGVRNKLLYDFWVGREINPRFGNLDTKFALLQMSSAQVIVHNVLMIARVYGAKSWEDYYLTVLVLCGVQLLVAIDYLILEKYFLTTFEIQQEGTGYMLAMGYSLWGFLYTSAPRYAYLSKTAASPLTLCIAVIVFFTGYTIYHKSNAEKHTFRMDPNNPAVASLNKIPTSTGKDLLCGGWWGWVRHPNYFGDILMNWAYAIPCGFNHWVPLFDPLIITWLLLQRAKRDNRRCWKRYGTAWEKYRTEVKYYVIPYVY